MSCKWGNLFVPAAKGQKYDIIKESAFWLITHTYFVAQWKTLYPCIHWIVTSSPYHFFSANSRNVANLLFWTPPRQFHQFPRSFAHSICGLSWQKFITRILIFQTILKLLNKNFLYIWLKTRSIAYLHIGLSEWHETQEATSPWATKALWKNDKRTFANSSHAICNKLCK